MIKFLFAHGLFQLKHHWVKIDSGSGVTGEETLWSNDSLGVDLARVHVACLSRLPYHQSFSDNCSKSSWPYKALSKLSATDDCY